MSGAVSRRCDLQVPYCGRGGRSPKALASIVVHTDIEGTIRADVPGTKYFQVLVDEAYRDKRVIGLKTRLRGRCNSSSLAPIGTRKSGDPV